MLTLLGPQRGRALHQHVAQSRGARRFDAQHVTCEAATPGAGLDHDERIRRPELDEPPIERPGDQRTEERPDLGAGDEVGSAAAGAAMGEELVERRTDEDRVRHRPLPVDPLNQLDGRIRSAGSIAHRLIARGRNPPAPLLLLRWSRLPRWSNPFRWLDRPPNRQPRGSVRRLHSFSYFDGRIRSAGSIAHPIGNHAGLSAGSTPSPRTVRALRCDRRAAGRSRSRPPLRRTGRSRRRARPGSRRSGFLRPRAP